MVKFILADGICEFASGVSGCREWLATGREAGRGFYRVHLRAVKSEGERSAHFG